MGKHRNDYSVVVFFPSAKAKKWSYVNKLSGFVRFLDAKHSDWQYMNVYNRKTREYLKRFYKGKAVPDFL